MSFVDPASDWCSASVLAIIDAISCCIRPHYNGTRLYLMHTIWCNQEKSINMTKTWLCSNTNLRPLVKNYSYQKVWKYFHIFKANVSNSPAKLWDQWPTSIAEWLHRDQLVCHLVRCYPQFRSGMQQNTTITMGNTAMPEIQWLYRWSKTKTSYHAGKQT